MKVCLPTSIARVSDNNYSMTFSDELSAKNKIYAKYMQRSVISINVDFGDTDTGIVFNKDRDIVAYAYYAGLEDGGTISPTQEGETYLVPGNTLDGLNTCGISDSDISLLKSKGYKSCGVVRVSPSLKLPTDCQPAVLFSLESSSTLITNPVIFSLNGNDGFIIFLFKTESELNKWVDVSTNALNIALMTSADNPEFGKYDSANTGVFKLDNQAEWDTKLSLNESNHIICAPFTGGKVPGAIAVLSIIRDIL